MFLTFAKLAGSAGVSQLTDVRRRAVKGLVAGVVIWTAVVLALGFALASGAVWMSQFMSFAAALLVIAGALVALALIVYLIALRPPRRTQPDIKAALSEAESALARTDPMTMVLTAVVLGFLVGRRGRK
jgi:sulfite exporter TauE/SafE